MRTRWMFALALLALGAGAAVASSEGERILSFDSKITVNADRSLTVTETIKVRCERKEIKRGIYRDFPTLYRGKWFTRRRVPFKVIEVLRDGEPEPYHTSHISNGKRVYIGRKDVLLESGEYTYALTYETDHQLGFFERHDELYWNVTGSDWPFPIEKASATVILPDSVPRDALDLVAYTGPQDAKGTDYTSEVDSSGHAAFATTRRLGEREGLTIVVGWPKGYIEEPGVSAEFLHFDPAITVGLIGGLLAVLYYLWAWMNVGKDPPKGTIIPRFKPSDDLSPAATRFLMEMGYDNQCFTAAVLNMAVKKFCTIEQEELTGTYTLTKTGQPSGALAPEEEVVARKLLRSGDSITFQQGEHKRIGGAVTALEKRLALDVKGRLFHTNTGYLIPGVIVSGITLLIAGLASSVQGVLPLVFMCIWLGCWTLGTSALWLIAAVQWRRVFAGGPGFAGALTAALALSLFALPFTIGEIIGLVMLSVIATVWIIPVVGLLIFLNLLFFKLMKAPTVEGRELMDRIEGFRMYLGTAEQERLNVLYAPERTPELFEKYLPYAVALDVENQWAEQFSDVLARAAGPGEEYSPNWYHGAAWHTMGASGFTSSFASAFSSAVAASATAPGSSSGGGGGGSSGGGGGGGGGGGW